MSLHGTFDTGITANQAREARTSVPGEEQIGFVRRLKALTDLIESGGLMKYVKQLSQVAGSGYLGDRTVAQINALSPAPARGVTYSVTDAGTLTLGSLAVVAGDVVEFSGAIWRIIVAGVGGYIPSGTRLIASGGTLVSPLTDVTDRHKVVEFFGTVALPTLTSPEDGELVVVNSASVSNGVLLQYDTTAKWVSLTAALPVRSSATPAAAADRVSNTNTKTYFANTLAVDCSTWAPGGRVEVDCDVVIVQDNGTDTLAIDLELGAVTLASLGAQDAEPGSGVIRGSFEVKASGASGVLQGSAQKLSDSVPSWFGASTLIAQALDMSGTAVVLRAAATWGATHADNKVDLGRLAIRYFPPGM